MCREVWEFDPQTAERRVIALPRDTILLSADGERWLLRDDRWLSSGGMYDPSEKPQTTMTLSLFHPASGRTRKLCTMEKEGNRWIGLAPGRDEVLIYSQKNGLKTIRIPPEGKNPQIMNEETVGKQK